MTQDCRRLRAGRAGVFVVLMALAGPGHAQSGRVLQNEPGAAIHRNNAPARVIGNSSTLPQGMRAPGRRAGDVPANAPNTGSNIGRDTAIPSLGGGLTIGGQPVGGTGSPASGPTKKRPGSTGTGTSATANPITPDEFGRQRQAEGLVNGRAQRLRDEANARNQNAPGNASGQSIVQGWQNRKNGLNPRTRPSRQSQQSAEGAASEKPKPGIQKDGTFVYASSDQLKAMSIRDRGRYYQEQASYRPRPTEPYERPMTLGRAANWIVPRQIPQGNCDNGCWRSNNRDTVGMPGRGRPAPDAVDNTNPTRPASLQNTGTAPFDPVEARRKKKRQVTLPGEREARDANLNALAGRPLDSSYRVNPNIVNPVRDDGTTTNRPARGPGAAPVGANRPASGGGGGGGCPPDNPTC